MKNMWKYILTLMLLITGVTLSACGEKDYLIKVNNDTISKKEFELYLAKNKNYFEEQGGADIWQMKEIEGQKPEEYLKSITENEAIKVKVQVEVAKKRGLTLTQDEIKQVNDVVVSKASEKYPKEVIERFTSDNLIAAKLYDEETKNLVVSDDLFGDYLKSNGIGDISNLDEQQLSELKKEYYDSKKRELYEEKCNEWKSEAKIDYNKEELAKINVLEEK